MVVFRFAHLSHATLNAPHLPFHIMASILLGYLAFLTRSLVMVRLAGVAIASAVAVNRPLGWFVRKL